MTEPRHRPKARPKRKRLTKKALRAWAWVLGAIAFLAPSVALALNPKPVTAATVSPAAQQRKAERARRRIIYQQSNPAVQPPIHYTYIPSTNTGGGGDGGGYNQGGYSGNGGYGGGGQPIASSGGS